MTHRHAMRAFWQPRLPPLPPRRAGRAPLWVEAEPFVLAILGFCNRLFTTMCCIPSCRRRWRAGRVRLPFLYNKWYFDELYDTVFVRGSWIGRLLWKCGDERIIDGMS